MQRVLSFEQTPPLSSALRFFLLAPVFAVAAAALLLWQGEAALVSRWSPATLALTHLLTLGFLATTMIGALFQMLPVVAGIDIPRPRLTVGLVWWTLFLGSSLLVAAFLIALPALFRLAALLLGLAFFWLIGSVGMALLGPRPGGAAATVGGMRLAVLGLAVTAGLGLSLAGVFGWGLPLPAAMLTDLHATWGLLGWVGILIIGVAFQVIPMFQATPVYPARFAALLPAAVIAALLLWSAGMAADTPWRPYAGWLLAACFAAFGCLTLGLLARRKRPKADVTTLYWRLSMASLLACVPLVAAMQNPALQVGVLFIVGCAMSAVSGMLYKIVPFLLWYHLQNRAGMDRKVMLNIKALLPDHVAEQQFWLHLGALALLLAATLEPALLARPAAVMLGLSSLRLWLNLMQAGLCYRRAAQTTLAAA